MVKSVSLDAWNAFCYDGMYLVDGNSKKYSRQIFSEVFPIHWAAVLIKMYQNKSKHICKLAKTQHLFGEITRHIFFGCCSVWIPLSTKRQTRFFYFNQKKSSRAKFIKIFDFHQENQGFCDLTASQELGGFQGAQTNHRRI